MCPSPESRSHVPPEHEVPGTPIVRENSENLRDQLLDELDRNVGRVLELQTIVDQEMFASKPDDAHRRLGEFRDALWVNEPEEVLQIRDEWKQLTLHLQGLKDVALTQSEEDMSEQQFQKFEDNEQESKSVFSRLREIEDDDRLLFLLSLDQLAFSLENKAAQVAGYHHDRTKVLQDAKSSLGRATNTQLSEEGINFEKSIKEIVYDTFSVTLIADQGFIETVYDGSYGFHNEHSPFSFAADLGEETERVINHERAHNIVDASVAHGEPGSMLHSRYKRIQSEKRSGVPDIIIQSERRSLLALLDRPGREQVDMLHDELLAEFSDLQVELHKNREIILVPGSMKYPLSKSLAFRFFCDHASTAGWEAGQYVQTLEKIAGDLSDPELAAAAARASDDFGEVVSTMLRHVMEVGTLGKQYGPAAERDAQAALYILRPSKYRHIPSLLRYKYETDAPIVNRNES